MTIATRPRTRTRQVHQVMEALSYGDAVSNITRSNSRLLAEMGHQHLIVSAAWDPRLAREVRPMQNFKYDHDKALIFHYWGFTQLEGFISEFDGPKALYYHNITPPSYFPVGSEAFEQTTRGCEQLRRIVDQFDIIAAPSTYNLNECAKWLTQPKLTLCVPPLIDPAIVTAKPADPVTLKELQELEGVKFLFAGRISPNKRHDQLMRLFDYYYREINSHAYLFLVGNVAHTPSYFQQLQSLRQGLASKDRIIFPGHLSDEALAAYYRASDVFVCASEHEGFCVPIVEAMALGLPVVSLDASAVPETVAGAGILVQDWDSAHVAEMINILVKDDGLRSRIVQRQRASLPRFSAPEVSQRLSALVDFLCAGKPSPFFVSRGPGNE